MASRLGSAGLGGDEQNECVVDEDEDEDGDTPYEFGAPRFDEVQIYHQPQRDQAGFNPNEEHAIIAPSMFEHREGDAAEPAEIVPRSGTARPLAAFAFQKQLNTTDYDITDDDGYTSEPYVLVQYFDHSPAVNDYRMAVYEIEAHNARYPFTYPIIVGEPLNAPYPLNTVIGLSNVNDSRLGTGDDVDGTYFDNGTYQATYWVDPAGTVWAISGQVLDGMAPFAFGHFYYPLLESFWINPTRGNTVP